jgi:YegS/Rv2252/BmrU family lipid kinase
MYFFIVNPQAGGGKAREIWEKKIKPFLKRTNIGGEIRFTERSGHALEIASHLPEGVKVVVSVGGDGTHNEVVSGLHFNAHKGVEVGFLTVGTGGDLRRVLGLPRDPIAQLSAIQQDRITRLDIGEVTYTNFSGQEESRHFINIASMGISGEVDRIVNRSSKRLGGFVSFLGASLTAILTYKAQRIRILLDGTELPERPLYLVAVANGRWFGGGMKVAPRALPTDGLFDLVIVEDLSLLKVFRSMGRIYLGTHLQNPEVSYLRGREVRASSTGEVLLDIDGEPLGKLPATFRILPEAIKVRGYRGPRGVSEE